MPTALTVLDTITVAIPCTESWEQMAGNDRVRFCSKCKKMVHDISRLTSAEALDLLKDESRKPCVRLYRRPDGRVLTADCSGVKRYGKGKWLKRSMAAVCSLLALLFVWHYETSQPGDGSSPEKPSEPTDSAKTSNEPREGNEMLEEWVTMGEASPRR
jgi:hypothetical protein